MDLNEIMRRAGSHINEYIGNASSAAAPGVGNDLLSFILQGITNAGIKAEGNSQAGARLFDAMEKGGTLPEGYASSVGGDFSNPMQNVMGGVFRELGLMRQSGALNPAEFTKAIMDQKNFPRFKQLIENITRRGLGDEFKGYRGAHVGDPLMNVVDKGGLPSATAISLDPGLAQSFAARAANHGNAGRVAEGTFTPESVLAFMPKRNTGYGSEKELIVDPRWANELKTTTRTVPPDKTMPYATVKDEGDPLLNAAMQEALSKFSVNRPIPGSPSQATAGAPNFNPKSLSISGPGGNMPSTADIIAEIKQKILDAGNPDYKSQIFGQFGGL